MDKAKRIIAAARTLASIIALVVAIANYVQLEDKLGAIFFMLLAIFFRLGLIEDMLNQS